MAQSAEEPKVRARIVVQGRVQRVGFRAFVARAAERLALCGGVRNLHDGQVELEVEGPKTLIETLLRELKVGPPAAHVTQMDIEWSGATGRFSTFSIWYENRP